MKDNRVKEEFYNWGIDGIDLLYNQRSQKAPPPFLRLHRPDLSMVEENFNADISKAAKLVLSAEYLTVLTGAGVSVESGVRPFRGPGGLWMRKESPPWTAIKDFSQIRSVTGREGADPGKKRVRGGQYRGLSQTRGISPSQSLSA